MAFVRPLIISTLTARDIVRLHMVHSCICLCIYYFYFCGIIIISLYWLSLWMPFVLMASTEAVYEWCSYQLQNAVIIRPGQWGMRDQNTWLVLNVLSCVYFSLIDCFKVAPAMVILRVERGHLSRTTTKSGGQFIVVSLYIIRSHWGKKRLISLKLMQFFDRHCAI